MIDWLSGKIMFKHTSKDIPVGRVASISPDGELEWQTIKRKEIQGSYDNKFTIRSCISSETSKGVFTTLDFSGNPVKFLQGHN